MKTKEYIRARENERISWNALKKIPVKFTVFEDESDEFKKAWKRCNKWHIELIKQCKLDTKQKQLKAN